jgi:type IV pilus assembly protein PilO
MALGLGRTPWYVQVGAFVAVSAAFLALFYYSQAVPLQKEINQRRTKLDALRTDVRRAQAVARQLPEFQKQVRDLERRLESLRPVLPEQKEYGELLRRINALALQSSLQIENFTPRPITTRQLHAEWPIALELNGTYHNLGLFFDRLSKFPRIINISDLSIRARDKPEPGSTITARCTATTFVLLEASAGTQPPAEAAPR